jgi:FdhD protein
MLKAVQSSTATTPIKRIQGHLLTSVDDVLAVEEPLEIRIDYGPKTERIRKSLSITMRTPGHDFELAAGFLFTEGLISDRRQIEGISYCGPALFGDGSNNTVRVELSSDVEMDMKKLERHFYTTSSCGVCGKSSLEALRTKSNFQITIGDFSISSSTVHRLPDLLREAQSVFAATGGLHAAALFTADGELLCLREDVGRHNAFDKIVGRAFLDGKLPLKNCAVMVSGRASFELLQKASMAAIPVFAAVGAPSSLAVDLAREAGISLLGFVRNQRFNIYSGAERILSQELKI